MELNEFLEKITNIGTCEEASERLTMLSELSEGVTNLYNDYDLRQTTIDTLNETLKNKDEKMSKLQEANMDLFLRVNAQTSKAEQTKVTTGIEQPEDNKLKFEDLFKEGGK